MAGLVQDDLQGDGDAEPEKQEEEAAGKVPILNAHTAEAGTERHGEDEREDRPRRATLRLLFLFVHSIISPNNIITDFPPDANA